MTHIRDALIDMLPKEWVKQAPQHHLDLQHAFQALVTQNREQKDMLVLQKGSDDFHGVYVCGAQNNSHHAGLECHGLANVRSLVAWASQNHVER